jgi:lysophospholipase L1-like esterase
MTGEVDFFADHVHFNVAGSERIATITAKALRDLLTGG